MKLHVLPVFWVVAVGVFGLTGCAQTPPDPMAAAKPVLNWSKTPKRIVLVRPDIILGLVTTGGMVEPQDDWSKTAETLLLGDIARHLTDVGVEPLASDDAGSVADEHLMRRLMQLYAALTAGPGGPGTRADLRKKSPLRDCLGPDTARLADRYGADYAVLFFLRDNYTSSGRVASNVAEAVVLSALSAGQAKIHYSDASRLARISLVDLHSGLVVWTENRFSVKGNLRDPDDAKAFVAALLKDMPH